MFPACLQEGDRDRRKKEDGGRLLSRKENKSKSRSKNKKKRERTK